MLFALLLAAALSGGCRDVEPPPVPTVPLTTPGAPPAQSALDEALAGVSVAPPGVVIHGTPSAPRASVEAPPFSRRQGSAVGIPLSGMLSPDEFSPPFINGRGVAAGDVDRDGFQDVLVATEHGIALYRNESGVMFAAVPIDVPAIADLNVIVVALVDLNDDGWLDIFLTSYMQGNHVLLSDEGTFRAAGWRAVPDSPSVLTTAVAFGDVDEDGDLDAYAGNWYYGSYHQIPPQDSINQLLIQQDGSFLSRPMTEEIPGETLAVLLSDFDMDGHLDLVVGNDFGPPDFYYLGDGRGGFRMISRTEELVPESTEATMSIDTADFDNDLDLDIYLAQIADGVPQNQAQRAKYQKRGRTQYCDELSQPDEKSRCRAGVVQNNILQMGPGEEGQHIGRCDNLGDETARAECRNEMLIYVAIMSGKSEYCERISEAAGLVRRRCLAFFKPGVKGQDEQYLEAIPQIREYNVLLRANAYHRFDNVAEALGVHISGWSWNSLFFDADDDEWQDIYVVNGTWVDRIMSTQKFFFRNVEGERFEERSDAFGLQSFLLQSAYVTIDGDNDGDLDLLVNGIHGPLWYYRNNEASHNSVLFELRDHVGNRYCVGCKVTIEYGRDGKRAQIREIKLGGGYHSFNPAVVHFGLGDYDGIQAFVVHWSTGEQTRIEGRLPANARYSVTREAR